MLFEVGCLFLLILNWPSFFFGFDVAIVLADGGAVLYTI